MGRIRTAYVCLALAPVVLSGCVKFDSGVEWAPDLIKDKPPPSSTVPSDPKPNLDVLLRQQATNAFPSLRSVRVSELFQDGQHWQFCARASSGSVTGGSITKTYLVKVVGEEIEDRRAVSAGHFCSTANYRAVPLTP